MFRVDRVQIEVDEGGKGTCRREEARTEDGSCNFEKIMTDEDNDRRLASVDPKKWVKAERTDCQA